MHFSGLVCKTTTFTFMPINFVTASTFSILCIMVRVGQYYNELRILQNKFLQYHYHMYFSFVILSQRQYLFINCTKMIILLVIASLLGCVVGEFYILYYIKYFDFIQNLIVCELFSVAIM